MRAGVLGWWFLLGAVVDVNCQPIHFETLTTKNGLSANEVNCLYEDRQHFLWVGTRDGINRFDGRRFQVFKNKPQDANSPSGSQFVDVLQDAQGIFWFASRDGGLTRYDPQAEEVKQFRQFRNNPKDSNSIATNRLLCLHDWDENYLLIGAEGVPGIFLHKKTFAFSYWDKDFTRMHPRFATQYFNGKGTWIHHFEEQQGQLYFSILNSGRMFRVDKTTGHTLELAQMTGSISDFFLEGGKIWGGGWAQGLYVELDDTIVSERQAGQVTDILNAVLNYSATEVLTGSRASGLFLVNKQTDATLNIRKQAYRPGALPSNKIQALLKDSRGILWVGTSAGLARYDERQWLFREAEYAGDEVDVSILHTHLFEDGSVAVNTAAGMFLSDNTWKHFAQLQFKNRGREIVPDVLFPLGKDRFILGTEAAFFEWQKGSAKLLEMNVYQKTIGIDFYDVLPLQVKDMLRDTVNGAPGFWMAVLGYGAYFYNTNSGEIIQYAKAPDNVQAIGSNMVRQLAKDQQGNLWVATSGGLYRRQRNTPLSENNFAAFLNEPGNEHSLPNNEVTDLWVDENGKLWVSTRGGGLAIFDGKQFASYLPDNPASSRAFSGMHTDVHGRIWCITKNGLEVFDRKQQRFFHQDVNDGSANTQIASHFSNAQDSWVAFSAGNRVFRFQPDEVVFDTTYPSLYLVDMQVFDKNFLRQAQQGVVLLKANERFVNFTVSALQFSAPHTVLFQYRLEGLEENWNNSADGEIKYTNLPWGDFNLQVRVTNPSGQWGGEKVLAAFHIATPFYYTAWFISLCVLLVAAIVFGIYRYRIAQLMKLQAIRNKIARDLHDDLGSTLGSISFLSEAANQQLQQQNHAGALRLLGKIGDNSRDMIESMSDIVWSVNPKNDTAKHLAERMRVFASDLLAGGHLQLHFESEPAVDDLKLSMEQRKNTFLIFKETIYNSAKYSGGTQLTVLLQRRGQQLLLLIRDDGTGFDVNNYSSKNGNGIKSMRLRAEEIGARYEIASSTNGTETKVTVSSA